MRCHLESRVFHWCLSGRILKQEWRLYHLIFLTDPCFYCYGKIAFPANADFIKILLFLITVCTFSILENTSAFPEAFGRPAWPRTSIRIIKRGGVHHMYKNKLVKSTYITVWIHFNAVSCRVCALQAARPQEASLLFLPATYTCLLFWCLPRKHACY